jgi:hypothetical protein
MQHASPTPALRSERLIEFQKALIQKSHEYIMCDVLATIKRMSLLGFVKHLSEDIGPRGSTTENEHKALDFAQEQLSELGLQPQRHSFLSATSAYSPFAVGAGMMLIALLLFWQSQPVGAAAATVIGVTVLIATVMELSLRSNFLRWVIPTDRSQNVWAVISAHDGASRPPILITAHVDTNRTPWLFRTPSWRRVFHALIPLGMMCMLALVGLFALGIASPARNLREIALVPGIVILLIFLLMLQAANSPFTPGANDNASGVAVALKLAGELARQPLHNRDVIVAFTGCEEVGGYGADALMNALRDRLRGAVHLVIDHVGGLAGRDLGPSVIRSERFLVRYHSDPKLLAIADGIMGQRPELRARAQDFNRAYSELTTGARHGLRTVGLFALDDDGSLPSWHVSGDVAATLNETTLERSFEFAHVFVRALDAEDV